MAADRTSISNRRVRRRPGTTLSNVPGECSSPSSVLHTKAAGRASIVVGSPSLGTTPRKIDLVRGSIASSLAICRVSISVVVDDVAALVDFQHGLELTTFTVVDMEAGAIALVGGQVKTEGVAVPEVAASLDIDAVDQEFILQKQVRVETAIMSTTRLRTCSLVD